MRASRLLPLTAAALCWATLTVRPALAGMAATAWSDLWRTPDQQGQALLDAGQPAQAAGRFHDPRRRAYADLQAGRYQDAAKLLAPFTDAQSEYNRGNALAKAGQLQAALAAYDAALKQSPADKDIRHNRDLVERALRQRRQSPQSSSANGRQSGRSADSQGQQQQSTASGRSSGSESRRQGAGSQQPGGSSQQSGAGGQSAGDGRMADNGPRDGSGQTGASEAGSSRQGRPRQSPIPGEDAGYDSGTSKETPDQARHDAAAAAASARKQRQRTGAGNTTQSAGSDASGASRSAPTNAGKAPDAGDLLAGGTKTPKQKPESERQLALDQWLRQIPDSPAGLLQRKFLIEHMMRQQAGDDPENGGR